MAFNAKEWQICWINKYQVSKIDVITKIQKVDFNATRQNDVAYWSSSGSQKPDVSHLAIHQKIIQKPIALQQE